MNIMCDRATSPVLGDWTGGSGSETGIITFALFISSTQLHKITILSKFTLIYVCHLFFRQALSFPSDQTTENPAFLPAPPGNFPPAG